MNWYLTLVLWVLQLVNWNIYVSLSHKDTTKGSVLMIAISLTKGHVSSMFLNDETKYYLWILAAVSLLRHGRTYNRSNKTDKSSIEEKTSEKTGGAERGGMLEMSFIERWWGSDCLPLSVWDKLMASPLSLHEWGPPYKKQNKSELRR